MEVVVRFTNRKEAGQLLARRLQHLCCADAVVLGLPRGGVPVAAEIARGLHCSLDVILVRKLGVPWQRELAFGALAEGEVKIINDNVVRDAGVSVDDMNRVILHEQTEIAIRTQTYRQRHARVSLMGKMAVIVDDGLATGATARAACVAARKFGARHVILAVPVAPEGWESVLGDDADEYVSVFSPHSFGSVGYFYDNFEPVSDDEVIALLVASTVKHT